MPSLYLMEQGAKLSQKGQRLIVSKDEIQIADIPLIKLESVLIYGNIQISTQAMILLLCSGVDTAFFSMSGKLLGLVIPPQSKNNQLRIKQYALAKDDAFSFVLAKKF